MIQNLQDHRLLVLDACKRLPGDTLGYVLDSEIAADIELLIEEVRDSILSLQTDKLVGVVRLENPDRLKAVITPDGRLALSQSRPFPLKEDDGQSKVKGSIKVVPKGLRSFDEHDADFFLELLPGPRRADGLPDSIHFWKARIEESDPEKTFKLGTVFGPSGCGKSSLVKAGLLPRLSPIVLPIYVEATATDTESSLLHGIKKRLPSLPGVTDLPNALDLRTTLIAAKQQIAKERRKLLLVIDQFEQWLRSNRGKQNTELVKALRECDGERVQALVMVRDDFSMALFRFLEVLGIDFRRGENAYVVHLFDLPHARKVLMAFGSAYKRLPETDEELNEDQKSFLDQALQGLSQDFEVVPVRLALFAEMVGQLIGGRPWTPATLREVGGAEGVGVTFLETTFNSPKDNPNYYVHQKAAQGVLKALLPESGTSIKGHGRSHEELLEASEYAACPEKFAHLICILDKETRLITPIDPEEMGTEEEERHDPEGEYYQLTHDYLVPSVERWLNQKLRETKQGRAELLLEELTQQWERKTLTRSEEVHLPRGYEIIQILSNIDLADMTDRSRQFITYSLRRIPLQIYIAFWLARHATIWLMLILIIPCCFVSAYTLWTHNIKPASLVFSGIIVLGINTFFYGFLILAIGIALATYIERGIQNYMNRFTQNYMYRYMNACMNIANMFILLLPLMTKKAMCRRLYILCVALVLVSLWFIYTIARAHHLSP
jgi:AAA domain